MLLMFDVELYLGDISHTGFETVTGLEGRDQAGVPHVQVGLPAGTSDHSSGSLVSGLFLLSIPMGRFNQGR